MKKLLSILGLLVACSAFGASHCVLPSGSGSQSGADWNNAYSGLPTTLVRGDTYYIGAGSYPAYTFNTALSGSTLITVQRATVASHGTATGWNNTFDGQVTFAYSLSFSTGFWLLDGQTGSNFLFSSYGFVVAQPASCTTSTQHYVTLGTVDSVTVRYMAVRCCGASFDAEKYVFYNTIGSSLTDATFSHCYAENMQGLVYLVGASNITTEFCYTTNAFNSSTHHGEVWDFIALGLTAPNQNITVRYCNAADGTGTGTMIANDSGPDTWAINGLKVYGNIFRNGNGGNGIIGCTTRAAMCNAQIYNNTFVGGSAPYWIDAAQSGSDSTVVGISTNNVATNNIVYNRSATIGDFGATPWGHDYNYYVSATSVPTEPNGATTSSNPFLNAGAFDFHVVTAGPNGFTLPSPYTTDPDGVTRGSSGWTRGAYQYVGNAPYITVQPQNQTVLVGANATFSVIASGTPTLTYQWSLNGANIAGATTSSYTTNAVVIGANGISYTVGVTNSFGGVLSSAAVLTVNQPAASLTNIYVAPNGLVSNTGATTNSPWPLAYALSNSGTNTTIFMMDGNYTSASGFLFSSSYQTLVAINKWRAVITNCAGGTYCLNLLPQFSNIVVRGVQFACNQNAIENQGNFNTFQDLWCHDTGYGFPATQAQSALELKGQYNVVERCLMERNGTNDVPFNHGVYLAGSNSVVRACVIRNNGGHGIQLYYSGNPITGNQVLDNIVYGNLDNSGGGSQFIWECDVGGDSWSSNTICGNVFFDNTANADNNYPVEISTLGKAYVTNNIIISTGTGVLNPGGSATIYGDYNLAPRALSIAGAHDVISATISSYFVSTNTGLYWLASGSPARSAALGLTQTNWFSTTTASRTDIGPVDYAAGLTTDVRVLDPSPSGGADYWTNITSGGVAPSITTQPVGTNIQVSQSFTLSVANSGTPPFNYQWLRGATVVQNGTAQSFTRPNAQTNDTGSYSVIVTNVFGTVTSSSVTVNVTNPAVPIMAISPATLNFGVQATNTINLLSFNVQNVGSGNLSFTASTVPPYSIVSGGTNTALVAGGVQPVTVQYTPIAPSSLTPDTNVVSVTNVSLGGTTNVNLTGIAYTLQNPTNLSMTAATILYGFVNSTTGTIYQPFFRSISQNSGVAYLGFSLPNQWTNAYLEGYIETTNSPNGFYVAIDTAPSYIGGINLWVISNALPAGLNLFPVTWFGTTNTVPVNYTNSWNLAAGPHYVQVNGWTANTLLGNMLLTQQAPTFPIPPNITVQPVAQTVLAGTPVTFTVAATGTLPLAYQWNFNGSPISGANQTAYSIVYPLPSDNGQYSCTVTNIAGATPSFPATLVVTNGTVAHVKIHIH